MLDRKLIEYVRIPNLSAKLLLLLAGLLLRRKPEGAGPIVDASAAELEAQAAAMQATLTARLRASNPEIVASEMEFDWATDALWISLRKALEAWEVYAHRGLDALDEAAKTAAELESLRARAKRAASLHERLFGAEGTAFVSLSFNEQVTSMATLLDLIAQDELGPELEELVGPELPRLIELCQAHYEGMVADRLDREQSQGENLNETRAALRWRIFAYNNAVLTLLDPSEPASAATVEKALRPMIALRAALPSLERVQDQDLDELEALVDELDAQAGEAVAPEAEADAS